MQCSCRLRRKRAQSTALLVCSPSRATCPSMHVMGKATDKDDSFSRPRADNGTAKHFLPWHYDSQASWQRWGFPYPPSGQHAAPPAPSWPVSIPSSSSLPTLRARALPGRAGLRLNLCKSLPSPKPARPRRGLGQIQHVQYPVPTDTAAWPGSASSPGSRHSTRSSRSGRPPVTRLTTCGRCARSSAPLLFSGSWSWARRRETTNARHRDADPGAASAAAVASSASHAHSSPPSRVKRSVGCKEVSLVYC